MLYSAEISVANPACVLLLVDQSRAMAKALSPSLKRSDAAADAANRQILNLILACVKSEGSPRGWFDIGLLGYSSDTRGTPVVRSLWSGGLAGRDLVSVTDVSKNPCEILRCVRMEDDGAGGLIKVGFRKPIWAQPEALYGAPLSAALDRCGEILEEWIFTHPRSHPPFVVHFTAGEPDDNARDTARMLRGLATEDGNVVLFHSCFSGSEGATLFPISVDELREERGQRVLFETASPLPTQLLEDADRIGWHVRRGSRAFVDNADLGNLSRLFRLGTSPPRSSGLR